MMKIKTLFFCLMILMLSSCTKEDDLVFDSNNLLLGNWVLEKSDNNESTFKRVNKLPQNDYGVSFNKENKFIQRTTGWCGTPPVTYFDAPGTYSVTNKLITVTTDHYMGNFTWRIESLTDEVLVVSLEK